MSISTADGFDMSRLHVSYLFFLMMLAGNIAFWYHAHDIRAEWANVPPAPSESGAAILTLGDEQFAYRSAGIMLQNLGDTGGRVTKLSDYHYDELGHWFFLLNKLDSASHFIPFLAAYYFGAVQGPSKLGPVVDFLAAVGAQDEGEDWRWLAQAVYLARYGMKDMDKALKLSYQLADLWQEGRPGWMKQMPVFVTAAEGDKQAAYDLMVAILQNEADRMHPNEVNFMISYICERLLDGQAAKTNPLCQDFPS